uniref:Uncharacterized protein n=1 Tax=Otus sunia TaxID=257818 RepID=A0A8C8A7N4_9STRI
MKCFPLSLRTFPTPSTARCSSALVTKQGLCYVPGAAGAPASSRSLWHWGSFSPRWGHTETRCCKSLKLRYHLDFSRYSSHPKQLSQEFVSMSIPISGLSMSECKRVSHPQHCAPKMAQSTLFLTPNPSWASSLLLGLSGGSSIGLLWTKGISLVGTMGAQPTAAC